MRIAMVVVLCLIAPSLGTAEPARDVRQLVSDDCARARQAGKTCVLDIAAEELTGERASAGDVALRVRGFGTQRSLIRVRHDFIPEIVKTAEDL